MHGEGSNVSGSQESNEKQEKSKGLGELLDTAKSYSLRSVNSRKPKQMEAEQKAVREKAHVSKTDVSKTDDGCCGCLLCLFCCFMSCYILCPPVPSVVTSKLAFNPPVRGKTYGITYASRSGKTVEAKSARNAYNKDSVKIMLRKSQCAEENSDTFIIKSKSGNYLVCVWMYLNASIANDVIILFAMPNACDLGELKGFRSLADNVQVEVCVFDYSGYGLSTGSPSEANIYEDIEAVYNSICNRNPTAAIVLVGMSIGTAACVDLAAKNPERLAGVVLISPFTSGCRLMQGRPDQTHSNCLDRFCSIDKIGHVKAPILLIHGLEDKNVPDSHSKALMPKIRNPVQPLYVHNATHNNILGRFPEVYHRIRMFIRREI